MRYQNLTKGVRCKEDAKRRWRQVANAMDRASQARRSWRIDLHAENQDTILHAQQRERAFNTAHARLSGAYWQLRRAGIALPGDDTEGNIRFWDWISPSMSDVFPKLVNSGPVKITLKPGHRLEWTHGGPTEEGYFWSRVTWFHCGDHIVKRTEYDTRDCDGRYTGNRESVIFVADIPWRSVARFKVYKRLERDHSAEAAGY